MAPSPTTWLRLCQRKIVSLNFSKKTKTNCFVISLVHLTHNMMTYFWKEWERLFELKYLLTKLFAGSFTKAANEVISNVRGGTSTTAASLSFFNTHTPSKIDYDAWVQTVKNNPAIIEFTVRWLIWLNKKLWIFTWLRLLNDEVWQPPVSNRSVITIADVCESSSAVSI